eukprot:8452536-Lingulodinium_polyedra.AAC.1
MCTICNDFDFLFVRPPLPSLCPPSETGRTAGAAQGGKPARKGSRGRPQTNVGLGPWWLVTSSCLVYARPTHGGVYSGFRSVQRAMEIRPAHGGV